MRRLPLFFVLDCSESMVGENLQKMEDGLQAVIRALRTDPHALETVHVSVIAFAGLAQTIVPLVEVVSFYPPRLPLGGGTRLGAALDTLMTTLDSVVVRSTPDRKGDWKPIVYLFTDGRPTDDPGPAIQRWNDRYAKRATLIAVGLGRDADFSVLKRLTEQVILFEEAKAGDFQTFVNWISASVVAQSRSLGETGETAALPTLDERVMRIVKEPPSNQVDESCVTLTGRCQKTRKPYIMKYERELQDLGTQEFSLQVPLFRLTGCYPLDESYFDWSDGAALEAKVSTSELLGSPGCPHCGAATAFAMCNCGKLLCVNGPGEVICPWCEARVAFAPGPSPDDGGFEVGRGRG
ncbi:VWA domain-containing protein [Thiorhodococcus mannitoliphagus]|uniref:VWA domain-containing protein n=1 Tax=Thiorhodococcus mannitoliphagus TaxID=329406 RepID=A0A6P1DNN2_9GAMM|nr:TerY-C metal binding domain-containing protein [Thiorhodococcus mannitoliphagus]NEX19150.1 VWA domain-containing protein [Thiorhodococcus mannitoliphagus]